MFVHQSAIVSNGFRFLKEGEVVSSNIAFPYYDGILVALLACCLCPMIVQVQYDETETDRGVQAANVRGANGESLDR